MKDINPSTIEVVKNIIDEYGTESIGTAVLRINEEPKKEYDIFDIDDIELFADKGITVAFIMQNNELLIGELLDVDMDDCRMILKSKEQTVSFLYNIFEYFLIIA